VEERWDDAHGLLCDQDQAGVTPADPAAHYAQPELTGYSIDGISVSNVNGQKSALAVHRGRTTATAAAAPTSRTIAVTPATSRGAATPRSASPWRTSR
jgi:hypothetical protein